jgi:hypothetical protein
MPKSQILRATVIATTVTAVSLATIPGSCAKGCWFWQSNIDSAGNKQKESVDIQFTGKTKTNPTSWVKGTIHVKAPAEVVWRAVHESRKKDPDLAYSRVLEQSTNEETYEEKFVLIPMLGSATCVLKDREVPLRRIDYQLIKSDHFKAMEGSWVLIPTEDGLSTTLELTSRIDLGLPVPQSFVDNNLAKKIERRLNHVKALAEASRPKVAQGPPVVH